MKSVGFDQKIRIHHLDLLVNKLRLNDNKDLYSDLDNALRDEIKGYKSRKNAITMLMKIWSFRNQSVESLKNQIILDFPLLTQDEQICAHYCMSCIAYSFFAEEMIIVYKNLKLSDKVQSKLILKQMKSIYGDRRRVEVATGAVLSSAKDWGIINMLRVGSYEFPSKQFTVSNPIIKYLMLETFMLINGTSSVSIETINNSALFHPFNYDISIRDIEHRRFTCVRNIRDILIERNIKIPYSI